MNGLRWFLLVVLLFKGTAAFSVEAVVSYAVFHKPATNGKDSTFLEVYWDINPSSLHYHKDAQDNLSSKVQVAVSISSDSQLIKRDRYILQTTPTKPGDAAMQKLFQFRRYYVPSGKILLRVDLGESDFLDQSYQFNKEINTLNTVINPHFSNLQLLDTFLVGNKQETFFKNGNTQVPRVLNFYDEGQRNLHFYTEVYNKQQRADTLVRHFYIAKGPMDYPILRLQIFDTTHSSAAVNHTLHTFDLSTLPSGNYYLCAQILNTQHARVDTQSLFFQMINKKPETVVLTAKDSVAAAKQETNFLDLSKTFVSKFTMKQIMAIMKMISPVADPAEVNIINNFFKKPDDMYMRYFVYNYFSKENKAHPEEAWKQFSNLIRGVNRDFNVGSKMGYETDRGRVFLQYGKPDERIRVLNESGAVPYEIWRYNAVGKTNQLGTFLFYQPGFSMSDFILLTSTVTGELYNPTWKNMLYSSGKSNGYSNSKAEQYMEGR